jgi:hypothetical protein
VNYGVLQMLQQHLHLNMEVVQQSKRIVAESEVHWYNGTTKTQVPGVDMTNSFDHLFVLAHYIQELSTGAHISQATQSRGFRLMQVSLIYIQDFNLLISVDATGEKGWTAVKRLVVNQRSLVRKKGEAALLLAAMLDAMVDEM